MVQSAYNKGLFALAITDHYGTMQGCPSKDYFEDILSYPMYINNVRVLKGVEANIITPDGHTDCEDDLLSKFEWVVASIHSLYINGRSKNNDYTELWLNIAHNPYVNIIGHSGSPEFPYNYDLVIREFAKCGKLVEINAGSFYSRKSYLSNCITIAKTCKKYNARIVVNSDAHCDTDVNRLDSALIMLKDIDFPQELIVNSSIENLKEYFDEYNIKY